MVVDRNAMNDVEKQILHDANDFFIIRVVAFDGLNVFDRMR